MTDIEAEQILTTLRAAFPHADNGIDALKAKDRQALYRGIIRSWKQARAGAAAIESLIRSLKFYPMVAELQAAYDTAARNPHPEREPIAQRLTSGNTPASPEEIKAACAEAIALVEASARLPKQKPQREGTPASVLRELERMKGTTMQPPEMRDRKAEAAGEGS